MMPISEHDEKRLHEINIQLEIVAKKIMVFEAPFIEGKMVNLSPEEMDELSDLFNQQKQLEEERESIPKR